MESFEIIGLIIIILVKRDFEEGKLVTFSKLVWLLTGRHRGVGIDGNRCNIFLKGGRRRNDGIST